MEKLKGFLCVSRDNTAATLVGLLAAPNTIGKSITLVDGILAVDEALKTVYTCSWQGPSDTNKWLRSMQHSRSGSEEAQQFPSAFLSKRIVSAESGNPGSV